MSNMEKGWPILSKIHKNGKESEEVISTSGHETTIFDKIEKWRGVKRQTYKTPEGGGFHYADRSLESEIEAKRTMRVYQAMKEANLPVMNFAKVIRKKIDGNIKYLLAMEDLTDNGKFFLSEITGAGVSYETKYKDAGVFIDDNSENPMLLKKQLVQAMAIMHNNGMAEFHTGQVSIALRFARGGEKEFAFQRKGRSIGSKKYYYNIKDFRIIDYPNFFIKDDPAQSVQWKDAENGIDFDNFEGIARQNKHALLKQIISINSARYCKDNNLYDEDSRELESLYDQIRESGERQYDPLWA